MASILKLNTKVSIVSEFALLVFFPKNPDEFNQIINDFTFNPNDFLYYPTDSSYSFDNGKISFKDSKDNITTYNYIPVCIVSGNVREINNSKVASLLWSWNKKSLSISPDHTLKQKIEDLKILNKEDLKLQYYGLAFREKEFENPLDSAIYQATIYTTWFCKKLNGFKIFCNYSSGGLPVELEEDDQEQSGVSSIIRPFNFIILYK